MSSEALEARLDDLRQVCFAPGDGYSAGEWCEAANEGVQIALALLAGVARLEQERDEALTQRDTDYRRFSAAKRAVIAAEFALAVASEREQRGRLHHAVALDVAEFHQALDIPIGDTPAIRRPELRAELIREEAKEAVGAIERGDLIEALDGLCDLLCVTYGAALEFGVNLAPIWDEVHRTNMAKAGGPVRADGKRLKPEGWTPPDIGAALARAALVDEPAAGPETDSGDDRDAVVSRSEIRDSVHPGVAWVTTPDPAAADEPGETPTDDDVVAKMLRLEAWLERRLRPADEPGETP